jgi:hypothetical protein
MNRRSLCALASFVLVLVIDGLPRRAIAVTLNAVDTFETGTTLDWSGNAAPTNVPTGGPAGAGDHFLRINSISSHLATFNISARWTGDYPAEDIKAIEMDMNHLADEPVSIRLYVFGDGGTFASVLAKPIASGAWKRYQFGLTLDDMTDLSGDGNLATTLSTLNRVLIRYDIAQTPTPPGTAAAPVTATLGIDNIRGIIPGDVNYDGVVDIFDVNLVSAHWAESGPTADANADYIIDIFDVNLISANWSPSGGAAVPEPATLLFAAMGVVGLATLERRRVRSLADHLAFLRRN